MQLFVCFRNLAFCSESFAENLFSSHGLGLNTCEFTTSQLDVGIGGTYPART